MDIGLLIVRDIVGVFLAAHGSQKLFGWLGGYGIEGTGAYMESVGLRPGKLAAAAAGLTELAGGAEYTLTNAAVVIALAFTGAGTHSLDDAIGWGVSGWHWGVGAAVAAVV